MNDFFLEQKLKRIEREANDELLMIQEFGAEAFSTYELEALIPLAREQADHCQSEDSVLMQGVLQCLLECFL